MHLKVPTGRRRAAGEASKELWDLHLCSHVHRQLCWWEIKRPHGRRKRPRNYINVTCRPACPIWRNSFANISIAPCLPKVLKCSIQDREVKKGIQVESMCQELLIISDKEIRITVSIKNTLKLYQSIKYHFSLKM